MNTYGYVRVSTDEQDHGVDAQKAAISAQVEVDAWYVERASGKDVDGRPVLRGLLEAVCDEQSCLVVAKLDRLGRSVVDVLQIFQQVHDCGASIRVLDMGIDTTTPAGKMMLTMLAAFAEFERAMIGQRTREGLAAARKKGVQLGRPNAFEYAILERHMREGMTNQEIADYVKCSLRTVQRARKIYEES